MHGNSETEATLLIWSLASYEPLFHEILTFTYNRINQLPLLFAVMGTLKLNHKFCLMNHFHLLNL